MPPKITLKNHANSYLTIRIVQSKSESSHPIARIITRTIRTINENSFHQYLRRHCLIDRINSSLNQELRHLLRFQLRCPNTLAGSKIRGANLQESLSVLRTRVPAGKSLGPRLLYQASQHQQQPVVIPSDFIAASRAL